jgi:hypothetical protein
MQPSLLIFFLEPVFLQSILFLIKKMKKAFVAVNIIAIFCANRVMALQEKIKIEAAATRK